jgi:hypothetical protein
MSRSAGVAAAHDRSLPGHSAGGCVPLSPRSMQNTAAVVRVARSRAARCLAALWLKQIKAWMLL